MKKITIGLLFCINFAYGQTTKNQQVPTGTGASVNATSPTLVTPNLGTPSAINLANATGTPTSLTGTNITGIPLTTGLTGGNWKTIYTNGSGVITELSLGTSGKVLTSNGASSAPTWETPSGGSGLTYAQSKILNFKFR